MGRYFWRFPTKICNPELCFVVIKRNPAGDRLPDPGFLTITFGPLGERLQVPVTIQLVA